MQNMWVTGKSDLRAQTDRLKVREPTSKLDVRELDKELAHNKLVQMHMVRTFVRTHHDYINNIDCDEQTFWYKVPLKFKYSTTFSAKNDVEISSSVILTVTYCGLYYKLVGSCNYATFALIIDSSYGNNNKQREDYTYSFCVASTIENLYDLLIDPYYNIDALLNIKLNGRPVTLQQLCIMP